MKIYKCFFQEQDLMVDVPDGDQFLIKQYKEELKSLDGRIAYCKDQIRDAQKQKEDWAVKEYKSVMSDCLKRKEEISNILKNHK